MDGSKSTKEDATCAARRTCRYEQPVPLLAVIRRTLHLRQADLAQACMRDVNSRLGTHAAKGIGFGPRTT